MIKFKSKKQTNTCINHITNEEINLKIHGYILNFYKEQKTIQYPRDLYDSMNKGYYKKIFDYIKGHIHD